MTSHYDNDVFELTFENAVSDAHNRADRGNAPSGNTWETIRRELSAKQMRAETADPRALGPDLAVERSTTERNQSMDAALAPRYLPDASAKPQRFGWMALMAAGLVGLMLITSVWINDGSPGDNRNDLAWAPGMGSELSTPEASPETYVYSSVYVCEAEPLTADQVFEIVKNPLVGYEQRGREHVSDEPMPEYMEANPAPISGWTDVALAPVAGDDTAAGLAEIGNAFWGCLLTGTAYQVWGMMDPTLVQYEILRNFPVIRTEEEIVRFIEEWGPQQYGSVGTESMPIMIGTPPAQAELVVSDSFGSTRVSTPRGESGQESRLGLITMVPATGENELDYIELLVTQHPDGSWTVNGVETNPNLPRG